jgi:sugar phosphate isomerase/epimerase
MVLGQNFRCGFYEVSANERLKQIKRAGFDAVMFWWGDEFEATDGNRYDLINSAFKEGLSVNTLHFPSLHADYLWREETTKAYAEQLVAAIQDCAKYKVENLVVHTTRYLITPPYNQTGLDTMGRAVQVAEREGVNIALENTRFPDYNKFIYSNIESPRLKLCYDTGHEHCYTPKRDILGEFGDKLVTTHIHDNCGKEDDHHVMGEGNINFAPIFKRLRELNLKYYNTECYCNETSRYYGKISLEQFLKISYDTLRNAVENSSCGG